MVWHVRAPLRCDGGAEQGNAPLRRTLAEQRAAALFEGSGDPIVEVGFEAETAVIRRANRAFRRTFAVEDGVVGVPVADAFEGREADSLPECEPRDGVQETDVERLTADGVRMFRLCIHRIEAPATQERRQLVTYRDETFPGDYDSKLAALHRATRELIQQDSTDDVVSQAVAAAVGVLGMDAASIHLLEEDGGTLVPAASTEEVRDLLGELPELGPGDTLAWRVYETGERAVFDSLRDHAGVYSPETPLESELIVPLGEYGVLIGGSTTPDAFSPTDVSLATILASNTEAALKRLEREEALAQREAELERQNERLEAFASMVSHDLRNPLNVAQGSLELARIDEDPERLEDVAQAHDRMETLIEDLLDLARRGEDIGEVEPVSLESVAREVWSLVRTDDATLTVSEEVGTVEADRSRLSQALANLFRNAIEHGGSDVTVRVGPSTDGFYVSDDGPGIPPEKREAVFEIGHSEDADGTGIGLAVVADVARAHGWEVSATGSVGGGTRFEFVVEDPDAAEGGT